VYQGTLQWTLTDDVGERHKFVVPDSFYIPQGGARLLSPQHWARAQTLETLRRRSAWCITYEDVISLHWNNGKNVRTITLDESSNVATIKSADRYTRFDKFCYQAKIDENEDALLMATTFDITPSEQELEREAMPSEDAKEQPIEFIDDNMSIDFLESREQAKEIEYMHWHRRLGHASAKAIRRLVNRGQLPKQLINCRIPLCPSCQYGRATRRARRMKPKKDADASHILKASFPGQYVSVDQLESATPGLIAQIKGMPLKNRYKCATVFIDHFSGLSYVQLQISTSAEDTLLAKLKFEQYALSHGVKILHYHADNGRFAENAFKEHCTMHNQKQTFCGVNAHFQNGIAERQIRTLQDHARTMLMYATKRWPEAIDIALWPYALKHANDILINLPTSESSKSPLEQFAKSPMKVDVRQWHTFGCPAYILNNSLQAGHKIPKWNPRTRLGIYLGRSPMHASTVALIQHKDTGMVSPQFHTTMDDNFDSVAEIQQHGTTVATWKERCHILVERAAQQKQQGQIPSAIVIDQGSLPLTWLVPNRSHVDAIEQSMPAEQEPQWEMEREVQREFNEPSVDDLPTSDDANVETDSIENPSIEMEDDVPMMEQPVVEEQQPVALRRSTRQIKWPRRLIETMSAILQDKVVTIFQVSLTPIKNDEYIVAMMAEGTDDSMYFHQAMNAEDKDEFVKAMIQEVDCHVKGEHWELVHVSKIPPGIRVLPAVWAMRRKRKVATGVIYRWKARLNIDGSKQMFGIDYWMTYAPVASWPSIRLVLIIAIIERWATLQPDYVMAFPQSDVETPNLFMKIPAGFEVADKRSEDYAVRLRKNLYSQKQAGRVWYLHLRDKLLQVGFVQSEVDECIFYRNGCIYVLYTDDSILTGPDVKELHKVVSDLQETGLNLTVEGDVGDFLGVTIDHGTDGTIRMNQTLLIDKIITDLKLDGPKVSTKDIPAPSSHILQ
jgi:hypothetical protein